MELLIIKDIAQFLRHLILAQSNQALVMVPPPLAMGHLRTSPNSYSPVYTQYVHPGSGSRQPIAIQLLLPTSVGNLFQSEGHFPFWTTYKGPQVNGKWSQKQKRAQQFYLWVLVLFLHTHTPLSSIQTSKKHDRSSRTHPSQAKPLKEDAKQGPRKVPRAKGGKKRNEKSNTGWELQVCIPSIVTPTLSKSPLVKKRKAGRFRVRLWLALHWSLFTH